MSYAAEVLADAPVLYWRLGEPSGTNAADASGNGNTGTYGTAVTLGAAGALITDTDTAIALPGVGDSQVTSAFTFTAGGSYTVEGWFKKTTNTGLQFLWSTILATSPRMYANGSTDLSFDPQRTGGGDVTWSAALPADSVFHHVAVTYNDSTGAAELFVDSVSQGTRTPSTRFNASQGVYALGADLAPSGSVANTWIGGVDEDAIYASILSPARIAAHFTAGTAFPPVAFQPHRMPLGV